LKYHGIAGAGASPDSGGTSAGFFGLGLFILTTLRGSPAPIGLKKMNC
jgi:hypothetical protein